MPKLLGLFVSVAGTAAKRAVRGWPVALAVLGYAVVMYAGALLLSPLGIVGGFILGFIEAACISSYLHLLSVVVSGSKLTWDDARVGFFALLWDVIAVLFVLWIASWGIGALVRAVPERAAFISAAWGLLVAIFLNPVPEIIYLRGGNARVAGVDWFATYLIGPSIRFIQAHWIEWFLPNLVFGFALVALVMGVRGLDAPTLMTLLPSLFSLEGAYLLAPSLLEGNSLWLAPVVLALCHYAMVYRGLLFQELQRGGWRARSLRGAWR